MIWVSYLKTASCPNISAWKFLSLQHVWTSWHITLWKSSCPDISAWVSIEILLSKHHVWTFEHTLAHNFLPGDYPGTENLVWIWAFCTLFLWEIFNPIPKYKSTHCHKVQIRLFWIKKMGQSKTEHYVKNSQCLSLMFTTHSIWKKKKVQIFLRVLSFK